MKNSELQVVLEAANDLVMDKIPGTWLDYLRSGWRIVRANAECGGQWVWYRPLPSGELVPYGCVCHHPLDSSRLIDTKMYRSPLARTMLAQVGVSPADVGKIFYYYPGEKTGHIVSPEELSRMNPALVGWWFSINEFDVIKTNE